MSKISLVRRAVSAVVVASLLAACGDDGGGAASGEAEAEAKVVLTFAAYGGSGQQAMIDSYQKPYTEAHPNVTFVNTSPPDLSHVKAQVEGKSVQWDIVAVPPAAATQGCGTLFEELDFPDLDPAEYIPQTIGKCYLGNWINANPVSYRTEAFPDPGKAPKTVKDFFDLEKFPGQRGILTSIQNGLLEYPLLADGVAPKDLYPLDVDRALRKLETIRASTTVAPNVGALQQAVSAKQVDLFILPDSRLVPLLDDGVDLTMTWSQTVAALNGFAVPKGSPNKEAARKFIQTLVSPRAVVAITEATGTAPVNRTAKPNLSANAKKVEVFGPVNTGETVLQDIEWYAQNYDQATAKVSAWRAAG